MTRTVTIRVPASRYADHDNCLAAAAADIAEERDLQGWNLAPCWADDRTRDTILVEVPARFVIEGVGLRGWSRDYVEAPGADNAFDTEADAEAAIDDLVRVCGWDRADLRVREL